jgi:predicted nuclease with TOPRIM domain
MASSNLARTAASSSSPSPPPSTDFSEASLNTLRLALRTMKERCTTQQKRIDDVEDENGVLRADRGQLYVEMNKMHEANLNLREKNLQLNQGLHFKTRENVDVRDQLCSLQDQHSDSVRQLERLQSEVTSLAFSRSGISEESCDVVDQVKRSIWRTVLITPVGSVSLNNIHT